jgi:Holliday junction resolvase RusA-like endonuclease
MNIDEAAAAANAETALMRAQRVCERLATVGNLADELLGPAQAAAERIARQLPQTWTTVGCPISFTILGQPCSKANSRKIVTLAKGKEHERTAVVKSKEALQYERDALRQIPPAFRLRLEGPVAVTIRIFYVSERPDLDESLILDVLQDRWGSIEINRTGRRHLVQAGVYRNDRQVREKHVYHGIDRANPRAEITVQPLVAQQAQLF